MLPSTRIRTRTNPRRSRATDVRTQPVQETVNARPAPRQRPPEDCRRQNAARPAVLSLHYGQQAAQDRETALPLFILVAADGMTEVEHEPADEGPRLASSRQMFATQQPGVARKQVKGERGLAAAARSVVHQMHAMRFGDRAHLPTARCNRTHKSTSSQ